MVMCSPEPFRSSESRKVNKSFHTLQAFVLLGLALVASAGARTVDDGDALMLYVEVFEYFEVIHMYSSLRLRASVWVARGRRGLRATRSCIEAR